MEITSVAATTHDVAVEVPLLDDPGRREMVFVRVETDEGVTGYGTTSKRQYFGVRELINREMAPILEGTSPLETERAYHALEAELNPRIQTGAWSSATSAVDIALWDIKGKQYGEPVWRLLGGAQPTVPGYVTFGLLDYSEDQLVEVATDFVDRGQVGLKMKVGEDNDPAEDAARVAAVREAVGDDVDLMIDANYTCSFDQALELVNRIERRELDLTWFEEPVYGNDAKLLRKLRERTRTPVSAGQNEGHKYRHRKLIANEAVDVSQPNVVYCGGYTEGRKVASLAETYNLDISNGAGFPNQNKHLHAAVPNGGYVEYHLVTWRVEEALFDGSHLSAPDEGVVHMPEEPGLGVEPDWDALDESEIE
ncbi:MAG: mandelate racemase/muconate lactonizing enzyme family protein [Haloferacaceae archaeon]